MNTGVMLADIDSQEQLGLQYCSFRKTGGGRVHDVLRMKSAFFECSLRTKLGAF